MSEIAVVVPEGGEVGALEKRERLLQLRAGLELPVSPHWLRHAHASHALDRGAPISSGAGRLNRELENATLGHSSITTTGRYLHARLKESSRKLLPL